MRSRRQLAAWLHDGPVQNLLYAQQELAEAERGDPEALRRAREILLATVRELRGELHPGLEELPALAATLALRGGFAVEVEVDPCAAGANDGLVLSLARELLTNVVRHAEATHATVRVRRRGRAVVLEVRDDGRGFAGAAGSVGLAAAAQRARLQIASTPG